MKKAVKAKSKNMTVIASKDYEKDFFKWSSKQVKHLKEGDFEKLDIENLIEEIQSLGNSNKLALESYLERIIAHKLKQLVQPEMSCKSWISSIITSQHHIHRILKNSPSLKKLIPSMIKEVYKDAKEWASIETEKPLSKFPKECPWTVEEILNP